MNKRLLTIGLSAMMAAFSPAWASSEDASALEREIKRQPHSRQERTNVRGGEIQRAIKALQQLESGLAEAPPEECLETEFSTFAGKYSLSRDGRTGKACRIYDLSFPTLRTWLPGARVSQVPVERFTARDYLNWIRGRYDKVYQRMDDIKSDFRPERSVPASWVSKLKFKKDFKSAMSGGGLLPQSFSAADLEVGPFALSNQDRRQLKDLLTRARQLQAQTQLAADTGELRTLEEAAENPSSLLEKIRFNWNDLDKVYDIVLEGEFLPLNGPIALVDFQTPYKFAVESILRGVLGTVLNNLAFAIPDITVRNLVLIAVNDTMSFIDMLYASQLAQLEDTLRAGLSAQVRIDAEAAQLQSALNLLFGSGSALFSEYILSLAQGQEFNWKQLEEVGRIARYREEKLRSTLLANLNSRLVLSQGCSIERMNNAFAVCSRNGQKDAIYSLMTDQQILIWNPGPPLIHRFQRPSEVTLRRSATWLLSAGIRMFEIPYLPRSIARSLGYLLQDYAKGGMVDEAHLKNHLWLKKQSAPLDSESQTILTWLYRQNLNPFSPKSEDFEATVIRRNSALLGGQP